MLIGPLKELSYPPFPLLSHLGNNTPPATRIHFRLPPLLSMFDECLCVFQLSEPAFEYLQVSLDLHRVHILLVPLRSVSIHLRRAEHAKELLQMSREQLIKRHVGRM
ncbi:hypothetical protein DACRYDRAFT_25175 [Dacryopinax primogenitus]|uniref:Uncharacterized protein n=1 Tax=Dacryopinax primogenitus (strain DJM 731) TaxID=1858805 RepID=M5G0W2_DACPD|nr:uncharacterized protein DACRYDRAFT_25175 [Dacryopinax primogenitus]EJT97427.1 hypothetical protein DACRYDRAFT_25175 [Dacryopinax primogenitus]